MPSSGPVVAARYRTPTPRLPSHSQVLAVADESRRYGVRTPTPVDKATEAATADQCHRRRTGGDRRTGFAPRPARLGLSHALFVRAHASFAEPATKEEVTGSQRRCRV